ncbi:hypothetical protein V8C86DRAFT_3021850 [Haematococcus lacustris]
MQAPTSVAITRTLLALLFLCASGPPAASADTQARLSVGAAHPHGSPRRMSLRSLSSVDGNSSMTPGSSGMPGGSNTTGSNITNLVLAANQAAAQLVFGMQPSDFAMLCSNHSLLSDFAYGCTTAVATQLQVSTGSKVNVASAVPGITCSRRRRSLLQANTTTVPINFLMTFPANTTNTTLPMLALVNRINTLGMAALGVNYLALIPSANLTVTAQLLNLQRLQDAPMNVVADNQAVAQLAYVLSPAVFAALCSNATARGAFADDSAAAMAAQLASQVQSLVTRINTEGVAALGVTSLGPVATSEMTVTGVVVPTVPSGTAAPTATLAGTTPSESGLSRSAKLGLGLGLGLGGGLLCAGAAALILARRRQ